MYMIQSSFSKSGFSKETVVAKKIAKSVNRRKKPKVSPKKTSPPASPSVAAQIPLATPEQIRAATRKFVQGVLSRGEAVPEGERLPPGATHEIIGQDEEGNPVLKLRRYSMSGPKKAPVKKRSQSARKKP
jgi:hypothetical protein